MNQEGLAENSGSQSHKGRVILIGLVMLLAAAIGYRLATVRHHMARRAPPQSVGVGAVTTGNMPETISSLGTVTPTSTVTIVPQLSGYLTKVGFKEGDMVSKGQFLAQIDPRPYEVQLQQYRAQLAKDQAALDVHAKLNATRPRMPEGLMAGGGEREDYEYNRTR